MIYEIAKQVDAAFREQGVPLRVIFGESREFISGAREHVAIDYIVDEKRDSFKPPVAQHRGDPMPMNRDQTCRARIFVRNNESGARWADHSRRCQIVLDHFLAELDNVVRERKNEIRWGAGGFVTLEDEKGSTVFGGAVYELDFTISRGVKRQDWAKTAVGRVVIGVDIELDMIVKASEGGVAGTPPDDAETASGG